MLQSDRDRKNLSGRGSVHQGCVWSEKCPSGKCPSGKCPSGKCPLGKCLVGELPVGDVSVGEMSVGELSGHRFWHFQPERCEGLRLDKLEFSFVLKIALLEQVYCDLSWKPLKKGIDWRSLLRILPLSFLPLTTVKKRCVIGKEFNIRFYFGG